ncbi:hypothetical protein PYW08_010841 [Mythimna loreyi]|uniref:Uncharacterized protein n=1 Tax=Mythimna loreyi TaxID=667449 RepID=A0ACC2Q2G2_9NEOP|nr:hypothetical protein PYW08_010841 [Mythimna loreyi]
MYFYTSFILFSWVMCVLSKSVVTRSGLVGVAPRAVGLVFFAQVNNSGDAALAVELVPDECCLDGDPRCDVLQVLGSAAASVPAGSIKTLHLVAPLLDPYERHGFCNIFVDYKSKSRPKNYIRDSVKIKFDTSLRTSSMANDVRICDHVDEDPLNDCKPVYCDTYYNGKRPHFNLIKKRCEEVPVCLSSTNSEVPTRAYNPVSNKCINKPAISEEDMKFIKTLTGGKSRPAKDILIIRAMDKNCSNSLKNSALSNFESDTVAKVVGVTSSARPTSARLAATHKPQLVASISRLNCFLTYVASNKNTLLALSGVILLQCCLICAMIYCFTKKCVCCKKKEVVHKFFNYRQDASVTTPLICTSNIDTDTTDFQYLSESSNYIDKKIRCYKACQKERKTSAKLSMSDDILSKCITRRDWHRLPRSETIPEARFDEDLHATERKEINLEQRKLTDIKVNFQDEKRETKTKPISVKSIVKKTENKSNASLSDSSEKVIRCHSYNYEGSSHVMDRKSSLSRGKTFGVYQQEQAAGSTEQGAQAYFSNDSIDDFLSERGVLFIGDNASKYSFTSISSAGNSTRSSKTSKNNVIRNVIPFLSTKSKGPASDPGVNKSKADLDLQLLHISRASMCSSSNDSDLCKDLKRTKDSTSSL